MHMHHAIAALLPTFLLTTTVSAQGGTPLASGELEDTGHTLRQGTNQMYLFTQYARGITNDFQIGTRIIGWLGAANVNGEYAILQSNAQAVSVSADLEYGWAGSHNVSLMPTYTLGGHHTNRFNAGLGLGHSTVGVGIPLRLSYDLVPNKQTTVRFHFRSDIMSAVGDDSNFTFTGGANWNRGWKKYRLALGLNITNHGLGELEQVLETVDSEPSLPPVYPLPYIRMWWRW